MIANATISAQKKEPNPPRAMVSKLRELATGDSLSFPAERIGETTRAPALSRRQRQKRRLATARSAAPA